MTSRSLEVQLLGRSAFRLDGGPPVESWPRPSARRLVTLLVVSPDHRRTREALADALFPHLAPDRAARSVSKALSMARSVLGRDVLVADGANIWIAEEVEVVCDLDDPDGPTASGMPLADDPYEDWAITIREDVRQRHLSRHLERARRTRARPDWEVVAAADPTNEEACLGLATAAAADADRDGVIAALDRHRRALAELGLEPRTGLQQQVHQLVERAGRPAGGPPTVAPPVLHGRGDVIAAVERRLLGSRLGAAVAQRGTAVVLGEAGIGKSSVVLAVSSRLQARGWRIGRGAASPDDHLAPMAAIRTALRALVPETSDPLTRRLTAETHEDDRASAEALSRLADEIDHVLTRLAEPALVVLDDLHWADAALQRLMVRLASRPQRTWGLLLAARSDEPGHPVPAFPSDVMHLELPVLDAASAAALVRAELPAAGDDQVAAVTGRGAGNPFFLLELARGSAAAGSAASPTEVEVGAVPARVVSLLRRRLEPVSAPARRLLEYLAVLGNHVPLDDLLEAAVELGPDGELLDELAAAWLVRSHEDGDLGLVHPLLRDAILTETNVVRRAALHSRAAETYERLAQRPGQDRDREILSAARHRVAAFRFGARRPEDALPTVHAAFGAGHIATRLFATEAAEELFEGGLAAFEVLDGGSRAALAERTCSVLRELGHIRLARHDVAAAEQCYRRALGLATSDMARARCWRALAWIPYRAGDLEAAAETCATALATLSDPDGLAAALLRVELGWCQLRRGELDEAVSVLEAASRDAEEAGDWRLAARALDRLGVALLDVGREEDSLATLEAARHAARRVGGLLVQAAITIHTAATLGRLGRFDEAFERLREGVMISEQIGEGYVRSVAHWVAADVHHARGDPSAALAERDAEVELLQVVGNTFNLAGAHAHRSVLLRELGRDAEAAAAAEAAFDAARESGDPLKLAAVETSLAVR